jgi:histidyl-tRNA synthetase
LVSVFDEKGLVQSIKVARQLRESGINTELFPDADTRLEKQLKYADKKGIKWLVIIGPEEAKDKMVKIKNMKTGEQRKVKYEEIPDLVRKDDQKN